MLFDYMSPGKIIIFILDIMTNMTNFAFTKGVVILLSVIFGKLGCYQTINTPSIIRMLVDTNITHLHICISFH